MEIEMEINNGFRKENEELKKQVSAFESNEKMFHALVETAVGDIGQDFFNNIVIKLSEWLNAECVIIGQLVEENRVEGFPMYLDGEFIQGFSYTLKNTPCDLTSKKGYCVYTDKLNQLFPESKDVQDLQALGYVGTALYNKEGEPNGILCAMSRKKLQLPPQAEDIMRIVGARITAEIERNKAKKELEISESKLKLANAAKDRFFSIIAHDLKSPFNSIIGFSELLLSDIKNNNFENIDQYAQFINDVSNQSYNLLKNLLDWSMIQTGNIDFKPEKFNLSVLFDDVLIFLQNPANQKNIKLNTSIDPDFEIFADENMITTILRNLVSNAIKYTENGEITIAAKKENNKIKLSVSDTGIGIKPEDIEKLFQIENNFSTAGTNNEKGTGLGLMLCKEFTEKHKGEIWVESELGKGSKFNFTVACT
ncbi:MAG: HAMP domain-containing histidine kinase [Mariniphaga sp.]|nr:HAMP domain-containing histidine kinase [Mariniphaga sp.]